MYLPFSILFAVILALPTFTAPISNNVEDEFALEVRAAKKVAAKLAPMTKPAPVPAKPAPVAAKKPAPVAAKPAQVPAKPVAVPAKPTPVPAKEPSTVPEAKAVPATKHQPLQQSRQRNLQAFQQRKCLPRITTASTSTLATAPQPPAPAPAPAASVAPAAPPPPPPVLVSNAPAKSVNVIHNDKGKQNVVPIADINMPWSRHGRYRSKTAKP
ncbi:hypothetical protein K438DRAFT_1959170 [Mycena galopus ATCC 62051]|nr:hypothetical protein K438DRAFT_1959170 [Mycena galopus ATCC 62051]